jgi:hypothetical protein
MSWPSQQNDQWPKNKQKRYMFLYFLCYIVGHFHAIFIELCAQDHNERITTSHSNIDC